VYKTLGAALAMALNMTDVVGPIDARPLRRLWFEDPIRKRLMKFQTETIQRATTCSNSPVRSHRSLTSLTRCYEIDTLLKEFVISQANLVAHSRAGDTSIADNALREIFTPLDR
jgi:hypothetical protein